MPNMSDAPAPAHLADPRAFFDQAHPRQRRYEILRAFFVENLSAAEVARRFECSRHAVYSVIRDFRALAAPADFFFRDSLPPGRLTPPPASARMPQSSACASSTCPCPTSRPSSTPPATSPPANAPLPPSSTARASPACRAAPGRPAPRPAPRRCRHRSACRWTPSSPNCSSPPAPPVCSASCPCCAATALTKPSNAPAIRPSPRCSPCSASSPSSCPTSGYSADDIWCMDRGPGLFAGLNVLPKAAWFSSYSDRTTRAMHQALLTALAGILGNTSWSRTAPIWTSPPCPTRRPNPGDWSGTRGRALPGFSAALAQDPDSGLLRSDATVRRSSSPEGSSTSRTPADCASWSSTAASPPTPA